MTPRAWAFSLAISAVLWTGILAIALLVAACATPSPVPLPVTDAGQRGAPLSLGETRSSDGAMAGSSPATDGGASLPAVTLDDRTAERRVWLLGQLVASATSTPAHGLASWYPARGMIAAVHSWRLGDTPYRVRVCASRCIDVTVSDYCQCYVGEPRERLIDLSDDAFRKLAPLSVGVLRVTVEGPTLPETDQ